MNKDILKELVICYKCKKVHKRKKLSNNQEARCCSCNALLYKNIKGLEYRLFSFSLTAMIFFIISMLYPIIDINISGLDSKLNIFDAVFQLFEDGYILVSIFALIVLIIMPSLIIFFLLLFSLFIILKINKTLSKTFLKILEHLKVWNMLDIFFVSILVAMVKIFDYAVIDFDVAFFSIIIYLSIEIYLTRHVYLESLWDLWEQTFE